MKRLILLTYLLAGMAFGITPNKVWRVSPGSTVGSWGAVNLADDTNAVTGLLPKTNIAATGQQVSSSTGSYSNSTSSFTTVASVTLTSTGRPVKLELQGGNASDCEISTALSAGLVGSWGWQIKTDGVVVGKYALSTNIVASGTIVTANFPFPASTITHIDVTPPSAGSHTYTIEARKTGGVTNALQIFNCFLVAYEVL